MSAFEVAAFVLFLILLAMSVVALFVYAINVFGERIALWANEVCGFREKR